MRFCPKEGTERVVLSLKQLLEMCHSNSAVCLHVTGSQAAHKLLTVFDREWNLGEKVSVRGSGF